MTKHLSAEHDYVLLDERHLAMHSDCRCSALRRNRRGCGCFRRRLPMLLSRWATTQVAMLTITAVGGKPRLRRCLLSRR